MGSLAASINARAVLGDSRPSKTRPCDRFRLRRVLQLALDGSANAYCQSRRCCTGKSLLGPAPVRVKTDLLLILPPLYRT
jgi:hypothetical protein